MKLSIQDISRRLGIGSLSHPDFTISTLLTDSRSLTFPEETLFFALTTLGGDGHRYVRQLYGQGVRNFVVSRPVEGCPEANILLVPDTLEALRQVARLPEGMGGDVVAIVGSRGKTTLKEWLFQLLEPLTEVVRSPRSWNSQIGVPLSLWEAGPTTRLTLIEAGISQAGEMQRLASLITPSSVIFTTLADNHDEGFASREEKALEKASAAAGKEVKALFYDMDEHLFAQAISRSANPGAEHVRHSFRNPEAELFIEEVTPLPRGERAQIRYIWHQGLRGSVTAPCRASYDASNAASAIAFMLQKGFSPEVVAARFEELSSIDTRLDVSEGVNGCTVIYDSYTSDLSSLAPAIDFMRRRIAPGKAATLILSDLRHEGGEHTGHLYQDAGRLVKAMGVTRFIGVGPELSAHAACFPPDSLFFRSTAELMDSLSTSDFSDEAILLKGAPEYGFQALKQRFEARTHETVLEVNLDAMVRNYNYFRSHLPSSTGLIAMVKASGYGAGSFEIAKTLQEHGAAYLAVAVIDEGIDLRQRGISMPIMVMNPKVLNYKSMFAYRLEPEIYNMEMLRDVINEARKNNIHGYPVHIKLDTGMHRMGFIEEELPEVMDILESQEHVEARSVFSHLATADCPDMNEYTELQLERFRRYTDYMLSRSSRPILRHVLNTAGILRYAKDHHYDMARLGIGLYGANTLPPEMERPLEPVSALRTMVISLREWEAGESVGYARRGMLTRKSRIATIPIGYADGMNRHFGNGRASVLVNGRWAPTVGNICMDACMIDVTDIPCSVGDSVEIFGPEAPVQRLADALDTIPYEVLTSVSPRVKRVYFRE